MRLNLFPTAIAKLVFMFISMPSFAPCIEGNTPFDLESTLPREFRLEGSDAHFVALWPWSFNHSNLSEPSLLTVFHYDENGPVSLIWIKGMIEYYNQVDDVWQDAFLKTVLISHPRPLTLEISDDARQYLAQKGTKHIATRLVHEREHPILPGPYAFSGHGLHMVWKLYEDTHDTFLHTLIQDSNGNLIKLRTAGTVPQTLTVAVPSRIQHVPNNASLTNKPLEGMRIAVKDNFQIKDVRMSACNRAYYELYPPAPETAACVQRLVDAGAVIVGTTKLASFAATEEPIECIDWQAPWNPRADGHQSPAGSSSGSGAAIAAYEWLDIAMGSDTSGSGRRPGHWNGCFAMRPTHGMLSHEGFLVSFPRFDTPTFFGRDLDKCKHFAKSWYGMNLPESTDKPFAIVYALDYMNLIGNKEQMKVIDAYVADLETSLGIRHQRLSFNEVWVTNPPVEANGASLQEYMKDVSRNSFFYEDYHNFDKFREDYRMEFDKEPYVSPPVRWQWELSSHITAEANVEALKRLEVYKKWFMEAIMKPEERTTLILIPIEEISPRYRDDATSRFNPVGVPNLFLSPILGAPELTIPIGEYPFESKCSGNIEKLPIAISMIAAPGEDLILFDIASDCLKKAGRPTQVLAGKKLFPSTTGSNGGSVMIQSK
ncbi:amidase signature domain-containing protein [Lophiotrema nucula]|uniref:Amidase signature domain-containing protein n=1 Tax=Lophiotrema nucula TaxID=690887 RepID=A0A6A5YQZ8_9PLEO|nr:amidase signature domain-containing protein [Lophiotrema nucula]